MAPIATRQGPPLERLTARQLFDGVHERMGLRWVSGMRGEGRVLEPGATANPRTAHVV
jgi:HPr kinase/phosphorylase